MANRQYLLDDGLEKVKVFLRDFPECVYNGNVDIGKLLYTLGIDDDEVMEDGESSNSPATDFDDSDYLIPWVNKRILQNRNVNAVFVGDTGSGKSYSAISLGYQLDPNFTADRIAFTTKEFLALVNSDLPKASVIIYDDAGLGIPAREWQSTSTKIFGLLMQGFRYKNLISLITVPDLMFIEKQSRMLMHAYFEATDVQGTMRLFRPFHIFRGSDQLGFRYPRQIIDGVEQVINRVKFKLPPKELTDEYERRKTEYMDAKNKNFERELEYAEKLKELKQKQLKEKISEMLEDSEHIDDKTKLKEKVDKLISEGKSEREVARRLKVSQFTVHKMKTK